MRHRSHRFGESWFKSSDRVAVVGAFNFWSPQDASEISNGQLRATKFGNLISGSESPDRLVTDPAGEIASASAPEEGWLRLVDASDGRKLLRKRPVEHPSLGLPDGGADHEQRDSAAGSSEATGAEGRLGRS